MRCSRSKTFELQEWEVSKSSQDKQLESIEQGLSTLGEIATAMGNNLDHQDVLINAVNDQVTARVQVPWRGSAAACQTGSWS